MAYNRMSISRVARSVCLCDCVRAYLLTLNLFVIIFCIQIVRHIPIQADIQGESAEVSVVVFPGVVFDF